MLPPPSEGAREALPHCSLAASCLGPEHGFPRGSVSLGQTHAVNFSILYIYIYISVYFVLYSVRKVWQVLFSVNLIITSKIPVSALSDDRDYILFDDSFGSRMHLGS